jgi:hypothetical protein
MKLIVLLFLRVWCFYLEHLTLDLLFAGGRQGTPLPALQEACFAYRKWLPLLSSPWVIAAFYLSRQDNLNAPRLAVFASSALLAAVIVGTIVIIASLLALPELIVNRPFGYGGSW